MSNSKKYIAAELSFSRSVKQFVLYQCHPSCYC